MKFWNLESALGDTKRPSNGEFDPIHTYRGHTKGITAVALSAEQNKCFSASLDRTVRAYRLVQMNKETYARLGKIPCIVKAVRREIVHCWILSSRLFSITDI